MDQLDLFDTVKDVEENNEEMDWTKDQDEEPEPADKSSL